MRKFIRICIYSIAIFYEALERIATEYQAYFDQHSTPELTCLDRAPRWGIHKGKGIVTFGMGAAVASMASAAPWLIALSMYKNWVFAISGALIGAAVWAVYRSGRTCPADPELAAACVVADKWNKRFLWVSGILWLIGFIAAYGLEYAIDI